MSDWDPSSLIADLLKGLPLSRRKRAFVREYLQRLPDEPTNDQLIAADLLDLQLI
jgi:hypothetical protein